MKPIMITIKVGSSDKIKETLEVIEVIKKRHPNAEFCSEVIV